MSALLFPGQGSQTVGMGVEFFKNFNVVKKIFHQADDKLKFSLSKIILEGPENDLQLTKNTQPAILTVSYAIYTVLKDEFNFDFQNFKCFAGHSLGEYSALVSSGSLEFEDALFLLFERGKAMQKAVPVGQGSMIAVLGVKSNELIDLIQSHKKKVEGICEIANDNADGQIIVSGNKNSLDLFGEFLKKKKVKAIPLKVSAPFHCSLMKPAAKIMEEKIESTLFKRPQIKIINNVNAQETKDPEEIKKLLVNQIFSTVKWRDSLINMSKLGVESFIEVGPGKALIGMVKRTIKDKIVNCFSINTIADIKKLINEYKK